MGGRFAVQLLGDLPGQGGVALHDVGGDLLVAGPGGVLHQHPALFLAHAVGQPNGVVVVIRSDLSLRPLGADVLQPLLSTALGHIDHRLLPQQTGAPGHAAAVVAVGGGDEGDIPQFPAGVLAAELVKGQLVQFFAQPFGQVLAHGVTAAQRLEGVQAKAVGFVLDPELPYPQPRGQGGTLHQRGGGVTGQSGVEPAGGLGLFQVGQRQRCGGFFPALANQISKVFHCGALLIYIMKI